VQRALLSVFPGTGSMFGDSMIHISGNTGTDVLDLAQTWHLAASPNLWIGVVAGAALLAGAIWFRRWRDDA
jgi:ABC-2 type transport system permease protein